MTRRHAERRFRVWVEKAGIRRRASPHSLRHTFATRLYARTADVLLVREALLHKSITSTLIYARADAERLRRVLG
jgi:integrase/recombinase XerD